MMSLHKTFVFMRLPVPENSYFIIKSINCMGKGFMWTVTWEKNKLHRRAENKVKTGNNKINPGKYEEKHNGRIEHNYVVYS